MQLNNYKIEVVEGRKIIYPSKFKAPVTTKGLPKIYIITKNKKIVYVGITQQPLRSRLRYGENPPMGTGYSGYKWLDQKGEYGLHVVVFNSSKRIIDIETTEAELVYKIRKSYGQWPEFQTEIHFHKSNKRHRDIADAIFNQVLIFSNRK